MGVSRPYWIPMTIAIVLKPDFTATFSRGLLRLAGTYIGLLLATPLFYALPVSLGVEIAIVGALVFVVRGAGGANYGIVAVSVTALVVFLLALAGSAPKRRHGCSRPQHDDWRSHRVGCLPVVAGLGAPPGFRDDGSDARSI